MYQKENGNLYSWGIMRTMPGYFAQRVCIHQENDQDLREKVSAREPATYHPTRQRGSSAAVEDET